MNKCTHKLGHFPDNQGLCHECGQPMNGDYLKAYRAGWNDSISQVIESINDLTVYGRLGNDYVEKMDLIISIKRLSK